MTGAAERQFLTTGRRYSALARLVIALGIEALALVEVPNGRIRPAAAALAGAIVWGGIYLLRLWRQVDARVVLIDAALVSAAGLAQPWVDVPYLVAGGSGWVQMTMLAAVIGYQWQLADAARSVRAAVTVGPAVSFGAGALLVTGQSPAVALWPAFWPLVAAMISLAMFGSLRAATRRVDAATARHERARAEIEIAAARRASRAEQLAALHDTAASTLMMVGLGEVADDEAWLAEQAERDLRVLNGPTILLEEDVISGLASVVRASGLAVGPSPLPTRWPVGVPAEVSTALIGAVGEALRNVTRHAGVDEVQIVLDRCGSGVRLEVRDRGGGFDPAKVSVGRGIRHSITERMERVGGRATVTSTAAGVNVRLEWSGERGG